MFLIHKHALNDVLYYVLGDERLRTTEPAKDVRPWKPLAAFLLCETNDILNSFLHKAYEVFPSHCCSFAK